MKAILVHVGNWIYQVFKQLEKRFYKPFHPIGDTISATNAIVNDRNLDWVICLSRNHAMILAFEYDCLFLLENILLSDSKKN